MTEPTTPCSFSELIQSDLFGSERRPFRVHSSAIAATSEPFRALVQGGLSESDTRSAELRDVEPDDFIRFLEYAYRRDYTVPAWVLDESAGTTSDGVHDFEVPPTAASPTSFGSGEVGGGAFGAARTDSGFGSFGDFEPAFGTAPGRGELFGSPSLTTTKKKRTTKDKTQTVTKLRSKFQSHRYLAAGIPNADLVEQCRSKVNSAANQNFTPVFLAHAHLYTFAEMRLIQPLMNLALHKLHATLLDFQLYEQRVGDIVELARYAYDHGPDRSDTGELNELRQLVVEYMACEVDTIGKHKAFHMLMEDGGEFVTDFWAMVSKYLLK